VAVRNRMIYQCNIRALVYCVALGLGHTTDFTHGRL